MYKSYLPALAVCALLPFSAFAGTYSLDGISFETEVRQSVWGSGAASEISGTHFLGAEWDEEFTTGGIGGSRTETEVPTIGYLAKLGLWETCMIIGIGCGDKPAYESTTLVVDTRTGAEAKVETEGKVGFDLNYKLDAGSMAATVDYDIEALLPEDGVIMAGEAFSLGTSSAFTGGEIDTQSPTIEASIDAVLKAKASADAKGCLFGLGCAVGSGTFIDIDEDRELVGVDPGSITYLDGFLPDGLELTTPLLDQTITAQLNVTPPFNIGFDGPFIPKPPGVYVDLAAVGLTVPTFSEVGGKVGDDLVVEARADFLDLTVDLDTLFAGTGILPPGGVSTSFGPLGVSMDAYDFDAGPSLDVFQDLKLTPTLMVDFDFSKPVEILGSVVSSFRGAWDSLPDFKIFEETTFTPTFSIAAILESITGLQAGLELTMDFLKASFGLSAFDVTLLSFDIGPLVSETFAYDPTWAKFSLFSDTFALGGFGEFEGAAFTLAPYVPPAPIPLPAGLPMLMAGLATLGFIRRKAPQSA